MLLWLLSIVNGDLIYTCCAHTFGIFLFPIFIFRGNYQANKAPHWKRRHLWGTAILSATG